MFLQKRTKFFAQLLFALVCAGCICSVCSHGRLKSPIPRDGNGLDTTGTQVIKLTLNFRNPINADDQCGGSQNNDVALTTTPLVPTQNRYRPGATIPVTWDITIPHDSSPGVKIAMSFSQTDSYAANILVPEGEEAGPLGENSKQVTLPTKTGQAVLKWQWCSDSDGGCYITCSDIVLDPNAPVANSGNGNSAGVSATIDNGGGDSGGTVVIVLLVIIGLLVVAYFGYKYWAAQDRRQFESEIRAGGSNDSKPAAVGMVTLGAKTVEKKRRGTFKDNRAIRRPPPTSRAGKLQPGWHEAFDPDSGDKYYYHDDGTTSWDKPQPFETRTPRTKFDDAASLPAG